MSGLIGRVKRRTQLPKIIRAHAMISSIIWTVVWSKWRREWISKSIEVFLIGAVYDQQRDLGTVVSVCILEAKIMTLHLLDHLAKGISRFADIWVLFAAVCKKFNINIRNACRELSRMYAKLFTWQLCGWNSNNNEQNRMNTEVECSSQSVIYRKSSSCIEEVGGLVQLTLTVCLDVCCKMCHWSRKKGRRN